MAEPTDNLILELLRAIRREVADIRALTLQNTEYNRRLERRIGGVEQRIEDLKDDLELMIKAELMGRLSHFETLFDHRLDALAERVAGIETR